MRSFLEFSSFYIGKTLQSVLGFANIGRDLRKYHCSKRTGNQTVVSPQLYVKLCNKAIIKNNVMIITL